MHQKTILDYAGDLSRELEEIEKLIPNEEQVEGNYTHTFVCDAWSTIKCC